MFGLSKKVDAGALDMMQFALKLTKEIKSEDEGNFISLIIFGMSNNEVVPFKQATDVFLKILYCGSSVVSAWRYDDFKPYTEYKSFFKMFQEENGDHSFCSKINLRNSDTVTLLNTALSNAGFTSKADKHNKSLYISLL